jgi:Protein of unknown function (DUF1579)
MHRTSSQNANAARPRARSLLAVLLAAAASIAHGQAPAPPCRAPEFAQFDFWLGDWTVRWTDKDGKENAGSNRIRKTHDGCVILEEFDGRPGTPLTGTSVSTFVPRAGKWKQTWVDNNGSYLDFEGEFRDGRMILSRRAPLLGDAVQQRMVFSGIAADSLTWDWQTSKDDGSTWTTAWQLRYSRRK